MRVHGLTALLAMAGTAAAQGSGAFQEEFDGLGLEALEPLNSVRWDAVVHSRAIERWFVLDPMEAAHGLDASPPPATHTIDAFEDAVYIAKEHLMTAINAEAYGLIYLTPNALADWSEEECVIRFDVSTLRTSRRDWIDLWITPWEDHMILPLEADLPDLQGNPRRGLQFRMETWNTVSGGKEVDWSHFEVARYDDYEEALYPVEVLGYESVLTPSPRVRETFELRITRTSLKFGLPDHDLWWIDGPIEDLGYDRAVIQFGHHSYNPVKDGTFAPIGHDTSLAGTPDASPNSWHWDAFDVAPATRFDILAADRRYVIGSAPESVTFERPAPAGAQLRFAALGEAEVSFDGAPFQAATKQPGSREIAGDFDEGFFSSYWMPVPEGTQTVDLQLTATGIWADYGLETMAKNLSIWSLDIGGTGCAGSAGLTPRIDVGDPTTGNAAFAVTLEDARPVAAAILATSFGEVETALCGIGVSLDPGSAPTLYARPVDAGGSATQPIPLPLDSSLVGRAAYAQWAVLDPLGTYATLPNRPLALSPLRRVIFR